MPSHANFEFEIVLKKNILKSFGILVYLTFLVKKKKFHTIYHLFSNLNIGIRKIKLSLTVHSFQILFYKFSKFYKFFYSFQILFYKFSKFYKLWH